MRRPANCEYATLCYCILARSHSQWFAMIFAMKKRHLYNRLICLGLFMPKPEFL